MVKSEMIKGLARKTGMTQAEVEKVLEAFFDVVGLSLACGEDVKLSGFGKFEVRHRQAMKRANPKSGEMIEVPAKRSLGFKPSPIMKARLNVE
jgi:nucleoid DNA-binding protein